MWRPVLASEIKKVYDSPKPNMFAVRKNLALGTQTTPNPEN